MGHRNISKSVTFFGPQSIHRIRREFHQDFPYNDSLSFSLSESIFIDDETEPAMTLSGDSMHFEVHGDADFVSRFGGEARLDEVLAFLRVLDNI